MSILPSDAKGNTSPSEESHSRNSNFENGRHRSSNFLRFSGDSSGGLGVGVSDPITNSGGTSNGSSNSVSIVETDHNRSSNKVSAAKSSSVMRNYDQNYCTPLSYSTSEQGGVSSLIEHPNGKQTGHNMATGGFQNNLVHQTSRRNQMSNGNYLLNFHYHPISCPQPRVLPPKRQQRVRTYNKDLFLQANYKFVTLDVDHRAIRSMDPDKMFNWEDVVCVRYSSPIPIQCPICLESPLCPQITTCGHVFCFPCILRYLLMGEEDHKGDCWKKCPLCFTMVSVRDLHTLYIDYVKHYQLGDRIDFTLLTRAKDSMIPLEKTTGDCGGSFCDTFSKLIVTSDVEISVRDAKLQLSDWLAKAEAGQVEDMEQLPYVCAALEQLELRKKLWMEHRAFSSSPPKDGSPYHFNKPCNYSTDKKSSHAIKVSSMHESGSSVESSYSNHESCVSGYNIFKVVKEVEEEGSTHRSNQQDPPETIEKDTSSDVGNRRFHKQFGDKKSNGERDSYTYYQSADGQLLILHPLNMKCLLHHYGSYESLPARISGEILQLETVTQSETMRKRYRFLSHFSLTTTFQLCEIDTSQLLPPDALFPFMDEIKKREYQRKYRARQEVVENARMTAESTPLIHMKAVNPFANFTTFSEEDFQALGSSPISFTSPPSTAGERKLFSDVTRLGFAAACDSPSLRAETPNDASSAEASSQNCPRGSTTLSFAGIISAASKPAADSEAAKANGAGTGKKGKKGSKVLLSTAGVRRY